MSLYLLQGAVEEGLIYAFVALALYISYRVLNIADLTTDGTFALGGVVAAVVTTGQYPHLALPAAMLAGAAAGFVTAFLQAFMKVPAILAGIITMTGLYSINLMVMGGAPNMYFPGAATVFTALGGAFGPYAKLVVLAALATGTALLLNLFFGTRLGLSIRATGDNPAMVRASSINPRLTVTVGLCLANALTALSGALWAQSTTQGDINIGTGTVVIGLASLILGGIAFRGNRVAAGLAGAVLGAIVYRVVLTVALRTTSNAGYLKLVSAVIVAAVISWPTARGWVAEKLARARGGKPC